MSISWEEEKRRRDNNLCVCCGAELPDTKYKNCEECRKRRRKKAKENREQNKIKYKELNKCYRCSYPLDENGKCQRCKDNAKKLREKAKENGLCVNCKKNKAMLGYTKCAKCNESHKRCVKNRYIKLKENNLCIQCRKPTDGKELCDVCAKKQYDYKKKSRQFYISNEICPSCHRNSIMGSEHSCPECRSKSYIYYETHKKPLSDERKKKMREYSKARREKLKSEHICEICGKRKSNDGYFTCGYCRGRSNESSRLKRQEQPDYMSLDYRRQAGICYQCGKQISIAEKSCPDCKKMIAERLLKARGYILEGENQ